MARIGVDSLYGFELLQDNAEGVRYGEPFRIAKAVSINVNPQSSEASLYADDTLVEYIGSITAFDITIEVDQLSTEIKGKLLGYKPDAKGVIIDDNTLNAPEVAVAFRSMRSDGEYEYRVLYKVRFNPTEERYETKGESVSFQTPTITGKAMSLEHNNAYGAQMIGTSENKTVQTNWFKAPYGDFVKGAQVASR